MKHTYTRGEGIENPTLAVSCDTQECANIIRAEITPDKKPAIDNVAQELVDSGQKAGWAFTWDGDYCPHCASERRRFMQTLQKTAEELAKKKKLVHIASEAQTKQVNEAMDRVTKH